MKPKIIVHPTEEPITLAEARLHLRLDAYDSPPTHPDDDWITRNISTARKWCEGYTGQSLAPTTLEIAMDRFPCGSVKLPYGPVTSVGFVRYTDGDDVVQEFTDYTFNDYVEPNELTSTDWPTAKDRTTNAVKIRYTAGFTPQGESPSGIPLPEPIKSAMLLVLGHLYENRENTTTLRTEELPMGAKALLTDYRVLLGMA